MNEQDFHFHFAVFLFSLLRFQIEMKLRHFWLALVHFCYIQTHSPAPYTESDPDRLNKNVDADTAVDRNRNMKNVFRTQQGKRIKWK